MKGIILLLIILYCLYNAFVGDRGLIITLDLDELISTKKEQLNQLERDRAILEAKLQGLMPGSIDPDYLEELAKAKLGFATSQESLLVIDDLR